MKIISKKNIYLLLLFVICLFVTILVPTYAKFASGFTTDTDIVGLTLSFDLKISNIEEYEEVVIPAGGKEKFNIEIINSTKEIAYYGIWYMMVSPDELGSNMAIGKLKDTIVPTSGSIGGNESVTATIAIVNNSDREMKVNIGVSSSHDGVDSIEYINGKYLTTGEVEIPKDIQIVSIKIDGVTSNSLPVDGLYTMNSNCVMGSILNWNTYNKNITYSLGAKVGDKCSLEFTTSTNYSKLSSMTVGSYVSYTGIGGTVGSQNVACKSDGDASSSITTDETESSNSCYGQNAREDLDHSNFTYGYCYSSNYRYYTSGWRIAYIDNTDINHPKAVLISAGAPECVNRVVTSANDTYIQTANTRSLKYCNSGLVDGDCHCDDTDGDGLCDSSSTDVWAVNDTDFYYMTKVISGVGKRLSDGSSALGDVGGSLGSTLYCANQYARQECGYHNDLIDNGGYYWFAGKYNNTDKFGVVWDPSYRYINYHESTYAYGLRPVIRLSSSVYVVGGSGTQDDPYQIKK